MPFTYPLDQKRIWKAFRIKDRDELLQDAQKSKLYELMRELEDSDIVTTAGLVDDALALLVQLDGINERIQVEHSASDVREVKRSESYLEGSEEYFDKSILNKYQKQKEALVQQLRDLIDPCGCFVVDYDYVPVIPC
jgi:hypothetical protein